MSLAISAIGIAEIRSLPSVPFRERKLFPSTKGVYFVLDGDEIVYIGMTSGEFKRRWQGHHRTGDIDDGCISPRIFFLSLDMTERQIMDVEKALVIALSPRLNSSPVMRYKRAIINTQRTQSEVDDYWQILGITQEKWMESYGEGKRHEIVLLDLLKKQKALLNSSTQC
jgi:hypothetical protein